MKIELRKINKSDGRIWFAVLKDGQYQIPFYTTLEEGKEAYRQALDFAKNGPPEEETILSTEL